MNSPLAQIVWTKVSVVSERRIFVKFLASVDSTPNPAHTMPAITSGERDTVSWLLYFNMQKV